PRVTFHVQRQTLSPHDVKRGRPPDAEKLTKKGQKRNRLRARNLMMISGWSGSSPHPTREGRTDGWVSGRVGDAGCGFGRPGTPSGATGRAPRTGRREG